MSNINNCIRYESPELIKWKKLTSEEQLNQVNKFNRVYEDKVKVVRVSNQAVEVSLFMPKEMVYDFLVEYESYLRESLGGFPIIVLLKDREDENRKRK
jgi:hypothetical protein